MQFKASFVLLLVGLVFSQALATIEKKRSLKVEDVHSEGTNESKERTKKAVLCMDMKDNLGSMNLLPQGQTLNIQPGASGLQTVSIQAAAKPVQALNIQAAAKPIQTLSLQPALQPVQALNVQPAVQPVQVLNIQRAVRPLQALNIQSAAQPIQTLNLQPVAQSLQALGIQPAAQRVQTLNIQPAVHSVPFVNIIQTQPAVPQYSRDNEAPSASQGKTPQATESKQSADSVEIIEKKKLNVEQQQLVDRPPVISVQKEHRPPYEHMAAPLVRPYMMVPQPELAAAYVSPHEEPSCHLCQQSAIKCRCSEGNIGSARAANIMMDHPMRYFGFRNRAMLDVL